MGGEEASSEPAGRFSPRPSSPPKRVASHPSQFTVSSSEQPPVLARPAPPSSAAAVRTVCTYVCSSPSNHPRTFCIWHGIHVYVCLPGVVIALLSPPRRPFNVAWGRSLRRQMRITRRQWRRPPQRPQRSVWRVGWRSMVSVTEHRHRDIMIVFQQSCFSNHLQGLALTIRLTVTAGPGRENHCINGLLHSGGYGPQLVARHYQRLQVSPRYRPSHDMDSLIQNV